MNRKSIRPARSFVPARLRVVASTSAMQKADALFLFLIDNLVAAMPLNFPPKSLLLTMIRAIVESKEFRGKANETVVLHTWGKLPWRRILLVGLGKAKELARPVLYRAAGAASRRAGKGGCRSVAIWLPAIPSGGLPLATLAQTIAEGLLIGPYSFDRFKTASA